MELCSNNSSNEKSSRLTTRKKNRSAIVFGRCYISNDSYYDAGVVSVKGSVIQ